MRFTDEKIKAINENLSAKKKANPISFHEIGIGVNLRNSIMGVGAFKDNWQLCEIEDIDRLIEDLEMLRDAITEETGIEF